MTKTKFNEIKKFAEREQYSAKRHRLYSCNATMFEFEYNGIPYTALRSYQTIVAIAEHSVNGGIWIDDYYSATTCQHISKFKNYLRETNYCEYPVHKMYKHSGMNKRTYENHVANDWSTC